MGLGINFDWLAMDLSSMSGKASAGASTIRRGRLLTVCAPGRRGPKNGLRLICAREGIGEVSGGCPALATKCKNGK